MPYDHPVLVSYYMVDAQQVVFNMWYLGWIDDAMTGYLAHLGEPYAQIGAETQVVRAELTYRAPVRFDDKVAVRVRPERLGTTSLVLRFDVLAVGRECARGSLTYVFVDPVTLRPTPIPDGLRTLLAEDLATVAG